MNNRERKPKKGGIFSLLFGLAILLLGSVGTESAEAAIAVILGIAVFAAVFLVMRRVLRSVKNSTQPQTERRTVPLRSNLSFHRDFPEPEAHCVSCELSGEDHFARDRALRLRQLDDWLRNGIIEKDEYRILKERYEKN